MNKIGFWDITYRENAPALLGVLRRYVKEIGVAQDLLHEVFITAIHKYDDYTGKGSFEGWLHRIAVNTALMYLRDKKNKQIPVEAVLSVTVDNDEYGHEQTDNARATIESANFSGEELLTAIDRLPEHHKMVFNMYVMDDFSHKQISAELHISPGTSKSHLARARKKIQQFLYDDALNKKRTKDGLRASALLLLFPAKKHYIDRLYQEGLSNFTLPPSESADFLLHTVEQHATSMVSSATQATTHTISTVSQTAASTAAPSATPIITEVVSNATFWGSKLSYIAACCGTAAVTSTACWLSMSDNSPLNHSQENILITDTVMYSPKFAVEDTIIFDATMYQELIQPEATQEMTASSSIESQDDVKNTSINHRDKSSLTPNKETTSHPHPTNTQEMKTPGSTSPPSNASIQSIEPVVVKKQVIQRETVVIRDTIMIQE